MSVSEIYIDNEPACGEWTSITQAGSSTCIRTADASFPDRGDYGLRVTVDGTSKAYATREGLGTLDYDEEIYIGWWFRLVTTPTPEEIIIYLLHLYSGETEAGWLGCQGDEWRIGAVAEHDTGSSGTGWQSRLRLNSWYWIVMAIKKRSAGSADGWVRLYHGGQLVGQATGLDNDSTLADPLELRLGAPIVPRNGTVADFDEIKISATYPEPYVPTPADEYLSARRTVVLYRDSDDWSRLIADLLVNDYDIPQCNLIPLPNATETESLADYATWQSQVEDDIGNAFTQHPTVAANCMCFVLGHHVPAYFDVGGIPYSGTSRLMNYGNAFVSGGQTNPLYAPSTVSRLTKTALASQYLATRIDGRLYSNSLGLRNAALVVSALAELADADVLYTDNTTYKASLDCQHLRILTDSPGDEETLDDAAFCDYNWGVSYAPGDYGDGSKVAFIDRSDGATTLREVSPSSALAKALYTHGWAAGLGYTDAGDAGRFDPASFYEMLRIGGTLAEAFGVAIPRIDYLSVTVGAPMSVAFQDDGYNVYRAVNGISNLGTTPVAYLRKDDSKPTLSDLGHAASTRYTYLVRPVYNDLETPDFSCISEMETAGDGSWMGNRPGMLERVDAEVIDSGKIRLWWSYRTPRNGVAVSDFGIYYADTPTISPGSPDTTESYTSDGEYQKDITLVDGTTYWFAITARSEGAVESFLSPIIGPYVADGTAPDAPTVDASSTF